MRKQKKVIRATAAAMVCCMLSGSFFSGAGIGTVRAEDEGDSEWNNIQSVVSRYYGEWNNTSYNGAITDGMPNTALLGNGDVGVTSAGNELSKSFYISKSDFWTYGTGSASSPCPPILIGGVTIGEQTKDVIPEPETDINLAPTYKTVSASSWHDDFTPDKAVNGEMQQSPSGYGWVSKRPQDPEEGGVADVQDFWLQLEFEEAITISRYVVKGDGAVRDTEEGRGNNAKAFELQVSETGTDDWVSVDTVTDNTESIFDKNLASPVTTKFVRLYITDATQGLDENSRINPRARVGQFELYANAKEAGEEPPEEKPESKNLALNKPILESGYINNPGTPYHSPGTMLIDGDGSTKWCCTPKENADGSDVYWAMIDLGEAKDISRWIVKHAQAGGEGASYNTKDFQLQYTTAENPDPADHGIWTDADVVTDNTEAITDRNLETPIHARYVRLLVTKAEQGSGKAVRIYEMELYTEPKDPNTVFYEKQDILNAEIQTRQELAGTPTEMKTWLSADKNIMVTELKSNGSEDAAFQVDTWASANDKANKPVTAANDDTSVTITRCTKNTAPDNDNAHVSQAALSTKIIGADDVVTFSNDADGKGNIKFTLRAGETVYIATAIGGGGRTYHNDGVTMWDGAADPIPEAQGLLAEVPDVNAVTELNSARQDWWRGFWSDSYIDLGTEDEKLNKVQKYYYGAQYLLGSASKEGELAPGLYGIWHTTDNARWSSDYHLNYNFISTFYGTNSSNRPELALSGVHALLDYVPEGQRRAASTEELRRINKSFVDEKVAKGDIDAVNGIEGAILFPVGIAPWGMTTDNIYLNEALDAAYNSYLMTQYYDYTRDTEFLENGVYDYMKQAVTFYEAWLEKEDSDRNKDGYEYVLYAGFNEGSWAKNPAVELAALKNTIKHLIQFSEDLGRDEDKRADWVDIYEHLGDQPTTVVNGKSVLALGEKQQSGGSWVDLPSPIPGDGNAIPLDAMVPGNVYNYFSSPEDLQIVRDTISVFSDRGAWGQINNFPRLFQEAVKSRYDIDTVVTKLVDVIDRQMAENLRINDNTHGIEKSGATEAINSMMLVSEDGITKIFPNWYTDKDAKFANLRARGAFTFSAEYDGAAQEAKNVVMTSEKGGTMTLVIPWSEGATVRDSAGNAVKTEAGTVPNWEDEKTITFATTAGETYTVEKGEAPAELDYEAIDQVIAEAEAIQQDGYTQESYQALQDALNNARDARQNATTQEELNQKKEELRAAIDGLKGSKNVLEVFLNRAKQHVANGDVGGLVESVQKLFDEAIAEGEAVMGNENATRDDVLRASLKLMKAIQALDMKAGDKADLGMALELTTMIDLTQYVEAGQAEYLAAKAEAEGVMENGDAMQQEVDAAWEKLVDTMMNLRLKADKSALSDLLNSVKDLDLGKYTDESVKVFKDALAKANTVMEDETLSVENQAEVDKTVKLLADARDGLTEKKGSGGNNNNGNQNGGQNGNNGNQNGGQNGNNGNQNGNGSQNNGSAKPGIKTGDAVRLFVPIMGLVLSFGAIAAAVVIFLKKRRR
ncbi:MAG: discoidin domain-containing protein [Muricomes sp.]|uniref:discoidin domain-containing protein n=1 Tax=Faecalicatena contorta TaxID=39482 RepID=UPI002EBD0EB4|nr:discoidin domain-containing protein [Muricomes sp.]